MKQQCMYGFEALKKKILKGETLFLAGDEKLLSRLPKGNWIGGTIPYFIAENGGVFTRDKVYVTELPPFIEKADIQTYDETSISNIYAEAPNNGFSLIIIPAQTKTHLSFALNAPKYESFASRPLIGWIAGVDLAELGKQTPKVFDGQAGLCIEDGAVAMHVSLPKNKFADVGILNLFEQGNGDTLVFTADSFSASEVLVNGRKRKFVEYLKEKKLDTKLPLVADYAGAMINISFQAVDEASGEVRFYAPVFKGVQYKHAKPIGDYIRSFASKLPEGVDAQISFSCNCILNYLYAGLEGKKTSGITGPITFGEIAYQLLNQTLVYLTIGNANLAKRFQVESSLRQHFKFLDTLLNTIPNPVFYKDVNGKYLGCNKAYEEFTGREKGSILGKTVHDIMPKEVADKHKMKDELLFSAPGVQTYMWDVKENKSGVLKYVLFHKATFTDSNGQVAGLIGVVSDISERVAAERSLKESRQRLSDIIDFLPDATFVIDNDGKVVSWNKAIERMTGIKAEEIMGKDNYEYALPFYGERRPMLIDLAIHPDPELTKKYTFVRRNGDVIVGESPLLRVQGKDFVVLGTSAPLYDKNGKVVGAIESIRDINERKKAEKEKEKFQAQLTQSEKMAGVGTLAAGVAHEFNNFMHVLRTHADLARRTGERRDADEALGAVVTVSEKAKKIIDGLLSFSRPVSSEKGMCDMSELLESVLALTERELDKNGIKVVRKYEETPLLSVEKSEISAVFLNMVLNARDAMRGGEGTLEVGVRRAGGSVEVEFKDTGEGIAEENLKKIFEPFYTTKGPLGRSDVPGTGLGLYVSYETVKKHGGEIRLQSEIGKGATFVICLPLTKPEPKAKASREEAVPEKDAVRPDSLSVLILDDEERMCNLTREYLSLEGYRAECASDGKKGVEMARDGHFDIAVVDILMAGTSGIQVLEEIRKLSPGTKVIMITGNLVDDDLRSRLKEKGAASCLQKPFSMEVLTSEIQKISGEGKNGR